LEEQADIMLRVHELREAGNDQEEEMPNDAFHLDGT
jgi:hypothetical protein